MLARPVGPTICLVRRPRGDRAVSARAPRRWPMRIDVTASPRISVAASPRISVAGAQRRPRISVERGSMSSAYHRRFDRGVRIAAPSLARVAHECAYTSCTVLCTGSPRAARGAWPRELPPVLMQTNRRTDGTAGSSGEGPRVGGSPARSGEDRLAIAIYRFWACAPSQIVGARKVSTFAATETQC